MKPLSTKNMSSLTSAAEEEAFDDDRNREIDALGEKRFPSVSEKDGKRGDPPNSSQRTNFVH